ncbi:hypothetical protein ES288_A01G160100v1 [Gossypium darwinii]|uniref:DUF7811 domain-containing protein n=1 Tax=Gossypium darwinii TaxID=34276 RepID=A0A5D2HP96_GOSDA|nr:hypothetical protein ES288_A01G160100v1 [Gossypium darwinii]
MIWYHVSIPSPRVHFNLCGVETLPSLFPLRPEHLCSFFLIINSHRFPLLKKGKKEPILMAKTSTIFLCTFSFSSFSSLSRWRETNSFLPSPFRFSNRPSPFLRFSSKPSDSGNFLGDDSFGFFPWSPDDNDLEWVQEERVTLFTSDGLIQIGGSMVPRRPSSSDVVAAEKAIKGGLHEKLSMTVAVPYLWGVPPASDTLHLAVRSGGGIVEKVYWQWDFL